MPFLPDGRKFAYTPEGMAKYKQEAAKLLPTEDSPIPGRLANTATAAAAGAELGTQVGGPWGGVIGGVIGGGAGLLGLDPKSLPKQLPFSGKKKKAADLIDGEATKDEPTDWDKKLRASKYDDMGRY